MIKLLSQSSGQTSVKGPGNFLGQKEAWEREEGGIQLCSSRRRPGLWSHKLGSGSFLPSWCRDEVAPSPACPPGHPTCKPGLAATESLAEGGGDEALVYFKTWAFEVLGRRKLVWGRGRLWGWCSSKTGLNIFNYPAFGDLL